MKKIVIVDGGPRKNMNTAQLLQRFAEGAKSAGEDVEVKSVRLYDIDYKGCMSCMACKLKGKASNICRFRDALSPLLDEIAEADGLVLGSPIYFGEVTGKMRAFLEQWFDSEREFEVRFVVVVAMCYFLNEDWLGRVFARLNSLNFDHIKSKYKTVKGKPKVAQQGTVQGTEPYYVRMGVAWLLATALAKFPDQTRAFVRSSNLPADVIKLYIRKARESFRTRTVEAV